MHGLKFAQNTYNPFCFGNALPIRTVYGGSKLSLLFLLGLPLLTVASSWFWVRILPLPYTHLFMVLGQKRLPTGLLLGLQPTVTARRVVIPCRRVASTATATWIISTHPNPHYFQHFKLVIEPKMVVSHSQNHSKCENSA